jgi:KUP system potassium uptake protein
MAGRKRLGEYFASVMVPLDAFLADVAAVSPPLAVRKTAVPCVRGGVPTILLHYFKHTHVLHEQVLLLTITSAQAPFVKPTERLEVESLGRGFWRVTGRFGYMETPMVPELLAAAASKGLKLSLPRTTYFLGRETLIASPSEGLARWRKILFAFVARNARSATAYFGIPPNRVMELGMQVEL